MLHRYPYKNASLLVKLFTDKEGIATCVARSGRKSAGAKAGPLTLFSELSVEIAGKGQVKTLKHYEAHTSYVLVGTALYAGFYLNELLLKLLVENEPAASVFETYCQSLHALARGKNIATVVRNFEAELLTFHGYQPYFEYDDHQRLLDASCYYRVHFGELVQKVTVTENSFNQALVFSGEMLAKINARQFEELAVQKAAKRLFSHWIQGFTGGVEFKSLQVLKALECSRFK